jgi:hypothetical protein
MIRIERNGRPAHAGLVGLIPASRSIATVGVAVVVLGLLALGYRLSSSPA